MNVRRNSSREGAASPAVLQKIDDPDVVTARSRTPTLQSVKRTLRHLLRIAGLKLVWIEPRSGNIADFSDPISARFSRADPVFYVDIERTRNRLHFSWANRGWHPFVVALSEECRTGSTQAATDVLREYYAAYRPTTLGEVYFPSEHQSTHPCLLHKPALLDSVPWLAEDLPIRATHGFKPEDGWQGFGPLSSRRLRWEVDHLMRLRDSIGAHGYHPGGKHGQHIDGILLQCGHHWRFLIRNGAHRASVLASLGWTRLPVRFCYGWPRSVDVRDLPEWPGVLDGRYDANVAREILTRYFVENGVQKAQRLGLF